MKQKIKFELSPQISQKDYEDEDEICYEFIESQKSQNQIHDLEKNLSLDIKTLQRYFQFNRNQDQIIPIMVSVKTLDKPISNQIEVSQSKGRGNLDLICVIDNSGSMGGEKIENVKSALISQVDMLQENDRLSLITFNSSVSQHCYLLNTDSDNKKQLKNIIKSIEAQGGTDIERGLKCAFSILENKRMDICVSSIFLLSDGRDSNSTDVDVAISKLLQNNYKSLQNECFTIHSFGFGNDHDGPLMQKIAQIKDGSFYYVQRNDQIDEFFIDALGGLFSVVAQDINIKIQINKENPQFKKFFKNSTIYKTYGDMWNIVRKDEILSIKINQLYSGVSKDFIFEIAVPNSQVYQLQDFERNLELIKVQLTATPINLEYTTQVIKESNLVLTLFTQYEQIAQDSEINENFEFNYIRVKAAQAMEEAINYADKNNHKKGQSILQDMLKKIEKSHSKNQIKLQIIKEDIVQCYQNIQPRVYENEGRYIMQQNCISNFKQQSQAIRNNDLYQNRQQIVMVNQQRAYKLKRNNKK